jgi:hypothetical protein
MGEIGFLSANIDRGSDALTGSSDPRPAHVSIESTPETDPMRDEEPIGDVPVPDFPLIDFRTDMAAVVEPTISPAARESALDEALLDATLVKNREEESGIRSSSSPAITALALALIGQATKEILRDGDDSTAFGSLPAAASERSSTRGRIRRLPGGWLRHRCVSKTCPRFTEGTAVTRNGTILRPSGKST